MENRQKIIWLISCSAVCRVPSVRLYVHTYLWMGWPQYFVFSVTARYVHLFAHVTSNRTTSSAYGQPQPAQFYWVNCRSKPTHTHTLVCGILVPTIYKKKNIGRKLNDEWPRIVRRGYQLSNYIGSKRKWACGPPSEQLMNCQILIMAGGLEYTSYEHVHIHSAASLSFANFKHVIKFPGHISQSTNCGMSVHTTQRSERKRDARTCALRAWS